MKYMRLSLIFCAVTALAGCASNKMSSSNSVSSDTSRVSERGPVKNVWDHIRRGYSMPNLHDPKVAYWVNYYASHPQSVQLMAQRSSKYIAYVVQELDKRNMPTELALLPFVESGYNVYAYSSSKAAGLWQFIPSSGTHYNLNQDWWKDERRDPVESTRAALDYLSYLYTLQGNDWHLALASYNWGEGSVQRAVTRNLNAGQRGNYLSLNMPNETRNYVPKLQAIKEIILNPSKYGITLPEINDRPYFAQVQTNKDINIDVAARLAGMSVAEFKALNPSYNRPVLLGEDAPKILIPRNNVALFQKNLGSYSGPLATWAGYRPTPGQSLSSIASSVGISVQQLRSLNGYSARQSVAVSSRPLLVPRQGNYTPQATPVSPAPSAPVNVPDSAGVLASNSIRIQAPAPRYVPKATPVVAPAPAPVLAALPTPALREVPNPVVAAVSAPTPAPVVAAVQRPAVASSVNFAVARQAPVAAPAPAKSEDMIGDLVRQNQSEVAAVSTPRVAPAPAVNPSQLAAARSAVARKDAVVYARTVAATAADRPGVRRVVWDNKPLAKSSNARFHDVAPGETLYSLAKRYNTSVDDLRALNNIGPEGLKSGSRIRVPGSAVSG